tara:strand:+ start:214 stop:429 length:216 start_codon:yes stop_codon:yes gene_type:complete
MKLTKSQLKQLIKEEIKNTFEGENPQEHPALKPEDVNMWELSQEVDGILKKLEEVREVLRYASGVFEGKIK